MVDVFEQVEEDLRSERYRRLARTWLPIVGGLLTLALVAALAWWGWDSWQIARADKASTAYDRGLEALQGNNLSGADTAFTEAASGGGAYRVLALSQRAEIALQRNNQTEAIGYLDQAAKASRDPLLSDQAALKAAFLVMEGKMTDAQFADLQKRLEPLAKEGRPLRAFAQEALAMAQLQMGQTQAARSTFVQLQLGQDVSDQVRQRAQAAVDAIDSGVAAALPRVVDAMAAVPAPAAPTAAPAATPAP